MKKKNKEKLIVIITILIALFGILKHFNIFESKDTLVDSSINENKLEIHYLDVGQGDSTLIKSGESSMLIDSGIKENSERIVEYIRSLNIGKLDYVIATHPHEDHIGGLEYIIDTIPVENIIMPNAVHNTRTFEGLLDSIERNGLEITQAVSGDRYKLGLSEFLIIGPNSKEYGNLNNYSVSMKLDYKNTSFMFTGDAEKLAELEMVEKYSNYLSSDVLKVGHHGSNTSTSDEFLEAVNPNLAVISVGKDNKYNHPNTEVIESLNKKNIKIYDTANQGDIILYTDGEHIEIENGENIKAKDKDFLGNVIIFLESILKDLQK